MRYLTPILLIVYLLPFAKINAQVGIGTNNPSNSAVLHLESSNKGVLFPRMTTIQRTGIDPVNGLIVFDTDSSTLYIYQEPAGWRQIKAIASLKDIVPGNAAGDFLIWNGIEWELKSRDSLFRYYYRDKDGDGFGDRFLITMSFDAPVGYVNNNIDCNDEIPGVTFTTWHQDADGDGYGTPATTITTCLQPPGYVSNGNDCNDNNTAVNPAALEVLSNGIDDDCDGIIDEDNSVADLPDDSFADTNGDGIDGTESAAIFVASNGNDANPGSKTSPKRTINAGISTALALAKTQVYVGDGIYSERVLLQNGISIYGGYSSTNWSRSATNIAVIQGSAADGRIIGIEASSITTSTTVDRITVITQAATLGSNYGVYCNNCTAIILKNSNIQSGDGGTGGPGGNGSAGAGGTNGVGGTNGQCDGSNGSGGPGGTSTCGRSGGAGGSGGPSGDNNGANGVTGVGGTAGGIGGNGCSGGCCSSCNGSPGANGTNGANGSTGLAGAGGSGGTISGGFWIGDAGNSGAPGSNGNGGGGGGGGGGQGGTIIDDGGGNGGGGGGAGGCAGSGGFGASGGGGSFGVFLINSTGVQLINNSFTSGNGAAGGIGGTGGIGGNGGNVGVGASACTNEIGRGGNGGTGGNGGNGGHGGGGAGGVSYAVYRTNTTVNTTGNTLSFGTGGPGGTSPGGTDGTTGNAGALF